jgi:peptidoglycan hydrolase-like protein with peptidoglycan-binding domain
MRGLIAIFAAACLLFSAPAGAADKRVAFVVGNGAYKNVVQLPNPALDAAAMAAMLRNIGFDVVEGIDLTRDQMTERLLQFGKRAKDADIALFFYAGHGLALNGTNYLLPVDADIKSEMDVKLGAAINVDLALDQTMSDAKVRLVFLDACRNNPFPARIRSTQGSRSVLVQSGLAEMKSGEGTLIAFATGPGMTALDGETGAHSPFTRALLANLPVPGIDVQQAMTRVRVQVNDETHKGQLPWGHTNLIGYVYLNPAKTPDTVGGNTSVPALPPNNDLENEFWRSVKDSRKPEELNAYLTAYPNGQYNVLAQGRIASLENDLQSTPNKAARNLTSVDPATFTDEANQTSEDQIDLEKRQRRDVQRRLTLLGFDTKQTGKFDDSTRAVIRRWQAARGYPATGYLNKLQHSALLAEQFGGTKIEANLSDDPDDKPPPRTRSGAAPIPSPDPGLPDFPWPPPAPSTYYVLPDNLLSNHPTVGEATDAIISALERTGYVERTFFGTKPGGVALVTRLERIEPDGTHVEPDRWSASEKQLSSTAGLAKFLRGLFFVEKGHYRLIVFILQDTPFIPSSQKLTEAEARGLINRGANVLPAQTRKQAFTGSYCTVLIYEFASNGTAVSLLKQSPLTAREHLEKAGVLSLLGKPN